MDFINCPKCSNELKSTVNFCPDCGYKFQNKQQSKDKGFGIFQAISLAAFFIGLFTPKLFLNFFVLIVIGSAIFSLARKEKRRILSIIALGLGFLLLILPSIEKSQEKAYKNNVVIVDYKWEQEGGYNYIRGSVRNEGNKVLRYFKVKAYYLDIYGNVLDTDIDISSEDLYPRMSKEFKIMHKNNPEYQNVKVDIDEIGIK